MLSFKFQCCASDYIFMCSRARGSLWQRQQVAMQQTHAVLNTTSQRTYIQVFVTIANARL